MNFEVTDGKNTVGRPPRRRPAGAVQGRRAGRRRGPLGATAQQRAVRLRPHPDQARRRLHAAEGRHRQGPGDELEGLRESRARIRGGRVRRRRRGHRHHARSLAGLQSARRVPPALRSPLRVRGAARRARGGRRDGVGADQPRLLARATSPRTTRTGTPLLFTITGLWAALEGSILLWALILGGYLTFVALKFRKRARRPAGRVGDHHRARRRAVLLRADARARPTRSAAVRPCRSTGAGRTRCCRTTCSWRSTRRSSTSGYVGLHGAVHVRRSPRSSPAASARAGSPTRGGRRSSRGASSPSASSSARGGATRCSGWGGYWAWDPVENASFLPVAHRHRVHPLGDRAGAARDAAGLEPVARDRDVLPHDPRHVPHPLRRHRLGARVHAVRHRSVAARVPRRRRRHRHRAHRVARRPAARARSHRLARSRASRRSSPNNLFSPGSRSSCCSARCSRCSPRRCGAAASRWASPTSTAWPRRSGSRCCS